MTVTVIGYSNIACQTKSRTKKKLNKVKRYDLKNGGRMCGFLAKQMKTKLIFIHLKLLMVVIGKVMYFDRQSVIFFTMKAIVN